tara:strand:+ start:3001 stop:3795 length:795 start_codon:yes stop_codon:yes gene_type:complete
MTKNLIKHFIYKVEVKKIINLFENENIDIRIVGGCIRDRLLNIDVHDIDFAVKCLPDKSINILKKQNIKFQDFGKKYGSIVAIINNKKFELTSLRKDINQKGRDTDVVFTQDWYLDAQRRDFTINSIYLSPEGKIYDYFNGYDDLKNKKIKFIGDIEKRITEDYIRILRYFRFLGCFKELNIIEGYEEKINEHMPEIFNNLKDEIIRNEILKMFKSPFPKNSFRNFKNQNFKNNLFIEIDKLWNKKKYLLGLNKCLDKVEKYFS